MFVELRQHLFYLIGGFLKLNSRKNVQPTVINNFFSNISIGTLQAYYNWNFNFSNIFISIHNSLSYSVTTHDTTKYIYQNRLHFRVFQNDFKGSLYSFSIGSTSYV